jgi:hypothetical protein
MRYKLAPGAQIGGVDPDDGSVMDPLKADKDGYVEVPDDWQTWHRILKDAGHEPYRARAREPQ